METRKRYQRIDTVEKMAPTMSLTLNQSNLICLLGDSSVMGEKAAILDDSRQRQKLHKTPQTK
jgi:hypothetical protein